jgi:Yersinia/Haemophilus virulence surface antigen
VHRGSIPAYLTSEDKALGDWICERTGSLSAISIRGGTHHAMAADLQNFIFFDPNVGEFKFGKDSDLRVLLNGMFPKNSAQVLASQYMKREQMSFREMERHSSH